MKNIILIAFVFFAFAKAYAATALQNYQQHVVEKGETLYGIAKKYNVSETELIQLNPDIKSGLKDGTVLLVPASADVLTQRPIKKYKKHRVRRKQTLYGIAQKYGVTVLDIKEANKELYSKELRKGDRIKIPVFEEPKEPVVEIVEPQITELPDGKYRVLAKETKYGIAKRYGIKTADLEQLNPEIQGMLQPGMVINVPRKMDNAVQEVINDLSQQVDSIKSLSQFVDYKVPPQMTMYSLENMTGISEDSLLVLNPQLKDGLKQDMMLQIPRPAGIDTTILGQEDTTVRLVDYITNLSPQRLAVMLPLSLNKQEASSEDFLKKQRATRIALDFYSGMTIARDSAQSLGITVSYDLYDTQKSESVVNSIISSNDFGSYNSVIGPLLAKNVVEAAKGLKSQNIPVVSPLTTTDVRLYKNLFQARPDKELLNKKLADYLVANADGKNIILVTDAKKPEFKNEYLKLFPAAKVLNPNKNNYIFKQKYLNALDATRENWVILAVDNESFITDAVSHYSTKALSHKITMFGYEDYDQFELPNTRLALLHYTYPSMNRDNATENSFSRRYYNKYHINPNSYATRGFDVAMDVILRQASADDLFESATMNSAQVENKFGYSKKFMAGYYNESAYLLQYNEDLSIKEIE